MHKAVLCLCLLALTGCGILQKHPPIPKTEFRGVWVASVANIDWPPSGTMSWAEQKEAYLEILDFYGNLNFNTIILQVRTAGDALYPTQLAPWSRYLSGKEGKAPDTNEDPLQWLIDQTHKRGMEFHAWFNPYRATFDMKTELLDESHDFFQHPEWMIAYGPKYYYDPGLPAVRDHLVAVMAEVVDKYPIDGLHFDDYFYPYTRKDEIFHDSLSYRNYAPGGVELGEWRRSNIDSLIKKVNDTLKMRKPWVQFGVSPFGVWKNKSQDPLGSDTRAGQTTFYDLNADPLLWMQEGWIDYLVPQLYWSMDYSPASFRTLINWWSENSNGINLYVGNAAYKVRNNNDKAWDRKKELAEQLWLTRSYPQASGNVFFSAKSLIKHERVSKFLRKRIYPYPALTPVSPVPRISLYQFPRLKNVVNSPDLLELNFESESPEAYKYAIVYTSRKNNPDISSDPANINRKLYLDQGLKLRLNKKSLGRNKILAVTFIDLYGAESQPIFIQLDQYDREK